MDMKWIKSAHIAPGKFTLQGKSKRKPTHIETRKLLSFIHSRVVGPEGSKESPSRRESAR
jgi:hypothetical protein